MVVTEACTLLGAFGDPPHVSVFVYFLPPGERAVLHDHARVFCMHMGADTTLTATSSSLSGQVLKAGQVYGGRPSKALMGSWTA